MNKQTIRIISLVMIGCSYTATVLAAPTTSELEQARDKSLAYLILHQNGDGSWGKTQTEKVRVTATVLDTFRKYNVSGLVYSRALNWLTNAEPSSTDSFARQTSTLAKSGLPVDTDYFLTQGINRDTVTLWGPSKEYRYTAVDSSLVLEALSAASSEYDIDGAVTFLKNRRNTNVVTDSEGSGWGFSNSWYNTKDSSKVLPTAQMLLFLHHLGGTHWGTSTDIDAAHWLALQQQTGGAIADNDLLADVETAMAVQALGVAKDVSGAAAAVLPAYESGLDYLIARQNTDGDIDANVYKTALAAQAFFNQEQTLLDTDSDGIPDTVEGLIGTDPIVVDNDYLELGNGNNYNDVSDGSMIMELVINQPVAIQIEAVSGTLQQVSGMLPSGLAVNPIDKTITGTPATLGNYTFSYRIILDNDTTQFGTLSLRVVTPESDTDNDGMPASYEATYPDILSSLNNNDADMDSDGDGLINYMEYVFGSDPTLTDTDGDGINDLEELSNIDTDNDGMPDYYELSNDLDPYIDDASGDLDNDGLTNYQEYQMRLPPNNPDYDNDGLLDGEDPDPFVSKNASLIPMLYLLLNSDE